MHEGLGAKAHPREQEDMAKCSGIKVDAEVRGEVGKERGLFKETVGVSRATVFWLRVECQAPWVLCPVVFFHCM